jgi:hypothetical protein
MFRIMMCHANILQITKCLLIAALVPFLVVGGRAHGQDDKDPHRPACAGARCLKAKSFVKAHYCGAPQGNGPDDSCEILPPKRLVTDGKVVASFDCSWIEGVRKCQQHGQPSPSVRSILIGELQRLGLPEKAAGQIYFTEWESMSSGWSLAAADYDLLTGDHLTLCEVIVIIDQSSQVHVLRKVPFQKADADKNTVTTWSPIDLADADGDGHVDVILEGDSYEDHWLEVESVQDGGARTIFSGLGYYL